MKGLFGIGKKDAPQKKYLVQYDREGCIGAGTCEAVDPKHWKLLESRKAELRGSKINEKTELFEAEISEEDFDKMKMAAEGCPRHVIYIINKETGEKVV